MRNKKEDKQTLAVETEIIVSAFDAIKRKEETFETDAENLTQMEFPEVKIVTGSFEETRFRNKANEEVDLEIYRPGQAHVEGRKLKKKRRASRRR